MNYREQKDILDIVKKLKDIDEQLESSNPDYLKLQEITIDTKIKFPKETSAYESNRSIEPNTQYIPINQMPINEFLPRMNFYRRLYILELIKKCGNEKLEELSKIYNISL